MDKAVNERIAIGALRPANSTAARVMAPAPAGHELTPPLVWDDEERQMAPLPMRVLAESERDLTGIVRGKLTVVGRRDGGPRKHWVCRCVCGYYTSRNSNSIVGKHYRKHDACSRCRHVEMIILGA